MHSDLTIDRNVRDWVFFPLMLLIVLMNILRQLAHQVRPCACMLQQCLRCVHLICGCAQQILRCVGSNWS